MGVVAAVVYALVPPFVPVLARLGHDMPLSAQILIAAYPFAIVLPLTAAIVGTLTHTRLLVPLTYLLAAGIAIFVLLALYVPLHELS
jgi:hypothetical protein